LLDITLTYSKSFHNIFIHKNKSDKEIRQKLWLHHIGNKNDESYRAVEERAAQIAQTLTRYQLMDAQNDKEIDEEFQQALKELTASPIEVNGKQLRKMRFVYDKLNAMRIDRGLVETDKNMPGIHISKGPTEKLLIRRMDVNNARELQKERSGMLCHLNEMLFIFNKKGVTHYGCLRSYLENNQGSKYIALFNPRFPANPKAQPSKFTTGSKIKPVSIGSATGVIRAHLDFDGHIKSYEVLGTLPEGAAEWFRQESGYGRVEDDPHH
jgi:CRISPR-associated endonuclease Csn1